MACNGNVLLIQNPLWNEEAERGEAAYGEDFGAKVGVFDMVRHLMGRLPSTPRDQQPPPLYQSPAA
mgnify:CR=1 FL=1